MVLKPSKQKSLQQTFMKRDRKVMEIGFQLGKDIIGLHIKM